jgi:hypothetical protein
MSLSRFSLLHVLVLLWRRIQRTAQSLIASFRYFIIRLRFFRGRRHPARPMQLLSASKTNPIVYAKVGRCIYCWPNDHEGGLTREHVVPIGMGGGIILPDSSCEKCRKVTHNFETACMKRALLPYRYHTGLVRHLDQLPEQIPLGVTIGPEAIGQHVAPDDHPYCLVLPKLEGPPGIPAGLIPAQSHFKIRYQLMVLSEEVQASVEEHGRGHIHTHMINFEPYWKMVAKIAYGFAVGDIGLDGFRPLIHDFITGKKPELGAYLIGDCPDALVEPEGHHQLAWKFEVTQKHAWISVMVGLFRGHGAAPTYSVIVGSATKETVVRYGLP